MLYINYVLYKLCIVHIVYVLYFQYCIPELKILTIIEYSQKSVKLKVKHLRADTSLSSTRDLHLLIANCIISLIAKP